MAVVVAVKVVVIDHEGHLKMKNQFVKRLPSILAVNVVHAVVHHRAEIADVAEVVVLLAAALAVDLAHLIPVLQSLDGKSHCSHALTQRHFSRR